MTLKYSESDNDPQKQAQLIESAVTEEVDGLAVSAPNPDAITDALQQAVDAGIPVITLNSGADHSSELGAITHVGQTEEIAGEGAGEQLKEAGAHEAAVRDPRAVEHRPQPALRGRQEGLRRRAWRTSRSRAPTTSRRR